MAKPKKNTFRLSVKEAGGFSSQSSGECGEGMAFALYMLPLHSASAPMAEGTAGEFQAARAAYLAAATKYRAETEAKNNATTSATE